MRLLLVIISTFVFSAINASELFLKHLDTGNGLSNNKINAIYRDSAGFIWIGTSSGLCRYDGYSFKIYHPDTPSNLPINGSYIEEIQEDADGNLWVRSGGDYYIYIPGHDNLENDVPRRMAELGLDTAPTKILIDREKGIWFYLNDKGLYYSKNGTDKAVKIAEPDFGHTTLSYFIDTPHGIITIDETGVIRIIDRTSLKVAKTDRHIASQLPPNQAVTLTIVYDNDELAWVYSNERIWLYDFTNDEWISDRLPSKGKNIITKTLLQDKSGKIWIGRDHHGLEQVIKSIDGIKFMPVADNAEKDVNNTVTVLYEDPTNTLWIGTYKKGVFYYNESTQKFSLLSFPDVNRMIVDRNNNVWVGTDAAGLMRWNPMTEEINSYPDPTENGNHAAITSLLETPDGSIYIGSYARGLKKFKDGVFEHLHTGTKIDSIYTWALALSGNNKNIWIGTLGSGLFNYNPATSKIHEYNTSNSGLSSEYIISIANGSNGTVYIATAVGVCAYNSTTQKIYKLENVSHNNITEIFYDSRQLLWVASREGLQVYDPSRDKIHVINLHNDLSPSYVLGIQEDKNGDMWIAEGSELIHINPEFDDKTGEFSVKFQNYDPNDGLQNSDFNQRSFAILPDGEILIGGLYGINHFDPSKITLNRTLPKVMFSRLYLGNNEITPGEEIYGHVVLKGALNRSRKIELWHGNTDFTLFLATDNYVLPEKNTFYYKLEGFNSDWQISHHNSISYTNIPPGKYKLLVSATNNDNYQSIEPAELEIIIHPPFWASPWAKLLYFLLFVLAIYVIYRMIRIREQRKFNEKRKEVAIQKQEELNQLKFRFFTNVSHDLRTPLTLIVSPLESMIKETSDPSKLKTLTLMRNNALRLLNMVNQLLDFRKNEVAGLTLHPTEGDIVAFMQNICQSFTMLSERNNVALNFFSPIKSLYVKFDEDKLSKIMMNLLGNAFKFTPEGGKVDVILDISDSNLAIRVADTGLGVKDEDKERIFERFYQADETGASSTMGNGIGLSLVSEYVKLHGGDIKVVDNIEKGSVFIVTLPLLKELHEAQRMTNNILPAKQENQPDTNPQPGEPLPEAVPEVENPKPTPSDSRPIALVVDDSADMLEFLKDGLSNDFHVITAQNGKIALKLLSSIKPVIILTDLMMPEMDGIELCRQLKASHDHVAIPIIILTAKHDVSDKVEGLTIGADDYITKPFNLQLLLLRMKKLVELTKRGAVRTLIDPEPDHISITPLDERLVGKAVKFVVANIKRTDLSVEELSSHLGMSRVHLYKKLKAITGKTPIEFIRILRLKRGAQMLRESQLNISEIAYQLGFNNPKYFSKYFKEEYGIMPSDYQKQEEHITNHPI